MITPPRDTWLQLQRPGGKGNPHRSDCAAARPTDLIQSSSGSLPPALPSSFPPPSRRLQRLVPLRSDVCGVLGIYSSTVATGQHTPPNSGLPMRPSCPLRHCVRWTSPYLVFRHCFSVHRKYCDESLRNLTVYLCFHSFRHGSVRVIHDVPMVLRA